MKREKEQELWGEGGDRKQDWGNQWHIFLLCHVVWGKTIHFLYLLSHFLFVIECWHSSLFNFFSVFKYHLKTASLPWTSILWFPKFSNASLACEDRSDVDLRTWQSPAVLLFHQIPDLFCLLIPGHRFHPPNHQGWNYKSYFRWCFLSIHPHIMHGQTLFWNLS